MRRPLAVLGWAELAAALLSTVHLLALGVSFSTHAAPLWRAEVSTLQQAPDDVTDMKALGQTASPERLSA